MSYCPNCLWQVTAGADRCTQCGAEFGAGSAWQPTEEITTPDPLEQMSDRLRQVYWLLWTFLVFLLLGIFAPFLLFLGPLSLVVVFLAIAALVTGALAAKSYRRRAALNPKLNSDTE